MPFFESKEKPKFEIDYNKYKPISVIVNSNIEGDMRPEIIRYTNPDESIETVKIQGIKFHRDVPHGILYCCIVHQYGVQKQIRLIFYVMEHIWVIEKW